MVELNMTDPVAVDIPASLPAVVVVPIPTECLLIAVVPSVMDRVPVTTAPDAFA